MALARSPEGKKMVRYTAVSVISVFVSQIVLIGVVGFLHWSAGWGNVVATAAGTIPSYELNRKWAWGKKGRGHFWKEVVPFWTLSFIGLAFSTWMAILGENFAESHHMSHSAKTFVVAAFALAAWGILWVGKFVFFNKVLFRTHPDDLDPALDGRTGLPT
jgi:putative flippase GtrA